MLSNYTNLNTFVCCAVQCHILHLLIVFAVEIFTNKTYSITEPFTKSILQGADPPPPPL
jgi:hypothetical protein